ncbi:MAG TPA: glycosyltransferase [Solirubrobacteraceae bacterium]|jgi:glycosyltransferase involved in cell wall biosynthesis|nr:glycosyltransferase [Solirubrobacteraceae bacterium]
MRVLILASHFPRPANPLIGIWALLQAQGLRRAGHDVRVISLTPWLPAAFSRLPRQGSLGRRLGEWASCPERHDWDGVTAYYPRWPAYHAGPQRALLDRVPAVEMRPCWAVVKRPLDALVSSLAPDAIFAHQTPINGYVAARIRALRGTPFVTIDHDLEGLNGLVERPRRRAHYQAVADACSAMVGVSDAMSDLLSDLFAPRRVHTLHTGADPVPEHLRARRRPRDLERRTILLAVGGFYPRKNLPLLVRAFAAVAADHPDAILRIIGDGEDRPGVEREIAAGGLADRVFLLGHQAHEVVLQEMVWCDAFALVGRAEPCATVYMEAMAAGKPLLVASDGGINDVIRDGVHGLAVPPGDLPATSAGLGTLLADRAGRERMGAAAQALQQSDLTWDANGVALAGILAVAAGGT